ncbi:MAG TPA: pyrroline-5-carboxylate reductase [Ruminococcaceae bacterium]|nr:pyrroline-5-carboxylate reductase [Oscillospiraceae bacterium]
MTKLGFIGAGNMGSAIMKGIAAVSLEAEVYAYDKDADKLSAVPAKPCKSEAELVSMCKYVLLAVKPQVLGEVLDALKPAVTPDTVFISICAGISEQFIRSRTIPDAKVVLVMPNTPMMLGMGASAMATDERTSAEEFAFAKSVIESCGIAEVIPIDKMKEIICINGSSPAFIYLFAKGFVDYAAANGIDADAALRLFAATLKGSAEMLTSSGMTADQLIKQVSSPGGTTIAGLDKLYEGKLTDDVNAACEACTRRAYELSQ